MAEQEHWPPPLFSPVLFKLFIFPFCPRGIICTIKPHKDQHKLFAQMPQARDEIWKIQLIRAAKNNGLFLYTGEGIGHSMQLQTGQTLSCSLMEKGTKLAKSDLFQTIP